MAKKAQRRIRAKSTMPTHAKAKPLKVSISSVRYMGTEPTYAEDAVNDSNRKTKMIDAFNWYNHHFSSKDALAFLQDYLKIHNDKRYAKVKKVSDNALPNAIGWLARMTLMGWTLNEEETKKIDAAITTAINSIKSAPLATVEEIVESTAKKPNIQDRMREKTAEAGGEIEGLLDQYIAGGCKPKHNLQPISILTAANILPAHVGDEIKHWESVKAEFVAAHAGKDADLQEGYAHLSKIQLRNVVKYIDVIIADYHGYVAMKKATKKPRKRKVKTPMELVRRLKYLPEHKELGIKSVKPTDIVGAKEMFVYDTKKRKLMYFVVDEYAGTLTVRNNLIEGFDTNKSTQKTLRKPKEQLKEFMSASKPNSRKVYSQTKSVETKFSGRFNENIVILKVW